MGLLPGPSCCQNQHHVAPGSPRLLTHDPPGSRYSESSCGIPARTKQRGPVKDNGGGSGEQGGATPNIAAFAGRCTLHGLSPIFLAGPLMPHRVAWAGAMLAAVRILLLYQVAERVQYYVGYDHITALDKEEGKWLIFPSVSLCNVNRVRQSRLTPSDLHWLGQELLGVELSDYLAYTRALGWPETEAPRTFPSKRFNMHEFVEHTSHNLEDMLLECRFGNRPCGVKNFSTVSVPGLCSRPPPLAAEPPHSCSGLSATQVEHALLRPWRASLWHTATVGESLHPLPVPMADHLSV